MTVKVFALNCGVLEFERRSFFPESERGVAMRVPVPAFLVTHPRGKVLFDTGIHADGFRDPVAHFGKDLAAYFKFSCGAGEGIVAQLRLLGIEPGDITHVVNSHLHFDHCGCNALFTRAEIFVQGAEMRATPIAVPTATGMGRSTTGCWKASTISSATASLSSCPRPAIPRGTSRCASKRARACACA